MEDERKRKVLEVVFSQEACAHAFAFAQELVGLRAFAHELAFAQEVSQKKQVSLLLMVVCL